MNLFRPYPLIVTIIVFALIGLLSLVSLNFHFWDPFDQGIDDYDITDIVYSQLRGTERGIDDRIVLVNTGRPDRAGIVALLDRIAAAGPRVIGVDVLLAERQAPAVDSVLRTILEKSSNIVLASTLVNFREDLGYFERESRVDTFFSRYARTAYTNFPSTATHTIRFFSPREPTARGPVLGFATAVAQAYDPAAAQRLLGRRRELERIHFTATQDAFIQFEPANILDSTLDLRPLLRDKIVLLGYSDAYNDDCPLLDKYYTPLNPQYTGRSEPDMFGIVIHANIIRMILDHKYIYTVPFWFSLLIALVYCYANVLLVERVQRRYPRLYHPLVRGLQLVEFTLLFFLIACLFTFFRIRWDFTTGFLALVLYFDVLLSYEAFSSTQRPWLKRLPGIFKRSAGG